MYKKHILDNGLRVVTEHIPHVKSISIGIWVEAGSKNEITTNNGISHFIEHMLFKGTWSKSAKDIAETIDRIGGQINAFTSKECTCYYTKVLDTHYETAISLLADMLFNSKFDTEDLEKERSVIFEEISMYEDTPEDLVHDLLSQTIFENDALGFPILGTAESLQQIDSNAIREYMTAYYAPNNAVISVAGNFNEENLLCLIKEKFAAWKPSVIQKFPNTDIKYNYKHAARIKDVEQTHFCLGFKGASLGSEDVYPLLLINNILGGSMSSRLFQSIREERGLAYSVYSYPSTYKRGGLMTIYAGMNPQHTEQVCSLIASELELLVREGLTQEEFDKAKEQLKGNYILGLESTSSRMSSIGKSELLLNKIYSPEDVISKIDAIKMTEVEDVIRRTINLNQITTSTVSKVSHEDVIRKIFT